MKAVIILLLSFILINTSKGQHIALQKIETKPFTIGITDKIKSVQLSEIRTLNIYLPDSYHKNDTAKYPVVYLLDGSADEDFIHIVGLVQFLTMIQIMPETIVVGIGNVDRKRDFTFPTIIDSDRIAYPTTGHSEKFISFIEQELQPYIQNNYRTKAHRTIIGQSLGGLLATEILLKKPALFDDYIIVSPSLWWSNELLLKKATSLLKKVRTGNIDVFIAVGNEGDVMVGDAEKLTGVLRTVAGQRFKVNYVTFPKENHLTILHRAVYKAFEVLNKK